MTHSRSMLPKYKGAHEWDEGASFLSDSPGRSLVAASRSGPTAASRNGLREVGPGVGTVLGGGAAAVAELFEVALVARLWDCAASAVTIPVPRLRGDRLSRLESRAGAQ
ncbi:hypothetical protein [Kibdelosporangium aridum]|uniref:Uncharacterized protein n=1 Tax=Kibdelosporangium aridum TaxID=2030 RepID=A0A1W2FMA3_KIBAR|nr:hypothetical protein [Kibdelosporangium aridum]SMD23013.1 hypothetical protein SAMN05661093_07794 [Kibdelosporangium aridum]